MNIFLTAVFGIIGLIIGYKIPDISSEIIEYKKKSNHLNKSFLYSNWMRTMLSIFNTMSWILAARNLDNKLLAVLISVLITLGIIIAFIDINIRIIPNELVLTMIILGIIFQLAAYELKALVSAIITMIVMMVVFMSVAGFVGLGKVGAGDVKLAGAIGLTLGYPLIIISVFIMAIVLLIFIVVGLVLKKIYLSTMLPLAPFMMCGFVFALMSLLFYY